MSVVINGVFSDHPFKVIRGVRQGDPLSCLLFDLAIEPLAEALRKSDLEGFKIQGAEERLIATLFANDTLVYLSSKDDWGDLVEILNEWCTASGAKFNIGKTEIIPIGKIQHRDRIRETRVVSGAVGTKIPDHIRIAEEGEPIRTLGAWVGNGLHQVSTWTRTLEKIDAALTQWELGSPTMEGRRLILLMVVGGMTQYLAKVQGMPKEVEKKIERRVRSFLWAEKKVPKINKETIYAPAELGGGDLLDIVAHNEAITITWLKSYLRFGLDRPMWAFVADELQAINILGNLDTVVDKHLRLNVFLQSWSSKHTKLLKDLDDLMKTALERDAKMEGLAFAREVMRGLPIRYHFKSQSDRGVFNRGEETKCLKEVGETETLARRLDTAGHRNRRNCTCQACNTTRTECAECRSPHACFSRARFLLNTLPDKWNPLAPQPEDYETQNAENTPPPEENEYHFDPKITCPGNLTDTFRIFGDGLTSWGTPPNTWINPEPDEDEIVVYTDGSATNNGREDAEAGAGIYYGPGDVRNRAIRVPNELQPSNNIGEILAIKEAIEDNPKDVPLRIISDSKTVIEGLTKHLREWEDDGFLTTKKRATIPSNSRTITRTHCPHLSRMG